MSMEQRLQEKIEQAITNDEKTIDLNVGGEVIGKVDLTIYYLVMEAIEIGVKKERDNLNDDELKELVDVFSAKYSDKLFQFELSDWKVGLRWIRT